MTDKEMAQRIGRPTGAKVQMIALDDGLYRRDGRGGWERYPEPPNIPPVGAGTDAAA